MTWHDLLFMHWPISETVLRPLVPAALEIDRFDGQAWIGVIPFRMTGVRPRWCPSFAGSDFPELNVRTYVRYKDRTGVWFFSLDAADRFAVWAARRFYHLPYQFAVMSAAWVGDRMEYRSQRSLARDIQLVCRYKPVGPVDRSGKGTLDQWLTERYCLFSSDSRGKVFRGDIDHKPWPLQPAEAEIETNTMTAPLGMELPKQQPLLHFAKRLDVLAWSLE